VYWRCILFVSLRRSILLRESLGPNQACTLFGASPGDDVIAGRSYIHAAFDLEANDVWRRNFVVLLGFVLFYQLSQILVIEFYPQYTADLSIPIYAKENDDTRRRNQALKERKAGLIKDSSSSADHKAEQGNM
jgi:ATP-binding cassette subfamily G (WHITE) protein 2 (SNQ2)